MRSITEFKNFNLMYLGFLKCHDVAAFKVYIQASKVDILGYIRPWLLDFSLLRSSLESFCRGQGGQ